MGWLIAVAAAATAAALIACSPALHAAHVRRQERGTSGGLGGVGAGFDSVWRPSADEARNEWEASVEAPAPAPLPGDKGRISDGRIVIRVRDQSAD